MATEEESGAGTVRGRSSGGRQVARATGIVSAATLLSRVLGLVRDMLIATYFGAGLATDAFFAAFKVPNLLRRLVAEGSLATAFVPIFTEEHARSPEAARRAVGAVTTFSLLLTLALSGVSMYYAEPITLALAPGFGVGTDKTELSAELLRIMLPYTVLVSILALAAGILNSLGKFALPALWPVFLNVGMIVCLAVFAPLVDEPVYVLAWSVLAGGILALIPQLWQLRRMGFGIYLGSPFRSGPVRTLCRLMLPSVLSASLYQVMIFINTLLASLLAEGSVTWLYYADRLFQFPLGVFTIAIATAVLPSFSRLAAQGDRAALGRQLHQALAWMTAITIPATVGLILLAEPIVRAIYEHGAFSADDSAQTAQALVAFALGLWSVSCQSIIVRAFLANKNAALPSVVSCVSVVCNVLFAFLFMGPPVGNVDTALARACSFLSNRLHVTSLGHTGLALSGSVGSLIALMLFMALLPRVGLRLDLLFLFRRLLHTACACVPMALALWGLTSLGWPSWLTVLIGVGGGAALFYGAALALRLQEAREAYALFAERLRRRSAR